MVLGTGRAQTIICKQCGRIPYGLRTMQMGTMQLLKLKLQTSQLGLTLLQALQLRPLSL